MIRATLTNTIVAGNTGGDVSRPLAAASTHNLIGGNPLLAPLSNYGGPTQTMLPLLGSPAINAGVSGAGIPTTDQRGLDRVGAIDIGAVESQGFTTSRVLGWIAVTPSTPAVIPHLTQQFTATGIYTDGSTQNLTSSVTWASGATSVATISSTGLASSLALGTSVIRASQGGITSPEDTLVVQPAVLTSIAISAANPDGAPDIRVGQTQQLTALGSYNDGSTQDLTSSVTWASGTTSVATISNTGLASGLALGTSVITASLGGIASFGKNLNVLPQQTFVVTNISDSGPGSLRDALRLASQTSAFNSITFDTSVFGAVPKTITLTGAQLDLTMLVCHGQCDDPGARCEPAIDQRQPRIAGVLPR